MDITRDITYQGFKLNDSAIQTNIVAGNAIGSGISGSVVDSGDFSDVDVVQFLEKRSQQDGMDAGDPFLGARRLRLAGTLYDLTRNLLFDRYWALRAALSPVLAFRTSPADKGYVPLYFTVPTNNQDATVVANSQGKTYGYPAGVIPLQVLAMPRAIQAVFQRDSESGEDNDSLAIPWQATFVCKDPSVTGVTPQDTTFGTGASVTGLTGVAATDLLTHASHGFVAGDSIVLSVIAGGAGLTTGTRYYIPSAALTANDFKVSLTAGTGGTPVDFTTAVTSGTYMKVYSETGNQINRGTYICPVNMLISVGSEAGVISVSVGDSAFTITVPASTGARLIRYKGQDKVLTVEEGGVETPRMNLLNFAGLATHPLIPAGVSPYTVTFAGNIVAAGSHMWFWESRA